MLQLMPLLRLLLPKLHVLQLTALDKLPQLLKEPLIRLYRLQQLHRLAAMQTVKAWNVCSRNRCPSSP
ncbi:MAG: hypothetical protein OEV58_06870 [Gammaproteobacteria bacterium]|nr:hypothetical protein [Gammaproteobacteria bacterium]